MLHSGKTTPRCIARCAAVLRYGLGRMIDMAKFRVFDECGFSVRYDIKQAVDDLVGVLHRMRVTDVCGYQWCCPHWTSDWWQRIGYFESEVMMPGLEKW